jgi:pimeloyl-ACP methyl ester carboxylesterase
MGLHAYAARFSAAGLAVFVFDYRAFGGSDGEPRNWISPRRHLEDWRAAIGHVESQLAAAGIVDAKRLALWGTSYAGGHSLVMAGELKERVSAVVAQVPFLDGKVAMKRALQQRGILQLLRGAAAALHDRVRTLAGVPAAYIPIAGGLGSTAMMQLDDHELGAYFSKHPKVYQGGWRNQARACWALEAGRYRPIASVPDITAPVLYITAETDSLCPPDVIESAVGLTRNARQLVMPCTHFDVYSGEHFEVASAAELEFLLEHLGGKGGAAAQSGSGSGKKASASVGKDEL